LGYIVANSLFSIGCGFIIGGIQHREQYFDVSVICPMSFVMAVATIAMAIPTIVHFIVENFNRQVPDNTALSHGSAVVLLLVYLAYLYFLLKSHTDLFDGPEVEQENEEELHVLPIWGVLLILVASIAIVTLCTQSVMANINTIMEMTHSSKTFIGFIIIPFLGNTLMCHTFVKVAMLDRMDLVIPLSVGYNVQILLFVIPFLILVVWAMYPTVTLSFGILETIVLLLSSFVTILILQKGRSTYMDGVVCLGLYTIIALAMFVYASDSMV
jgi:Ca2+:H+ antiporter